MKGKKISIIRPEVELEINSVFGWLLLPFFVLRVLGIGIRLFTFPVLIGKLECGKYRVLSIPKMTVKRADAPAKSDIS